MATKSGRPVAAYRCTACGAGAPAWVGRCPQCQEWGTVEEAPAVRAARGPAVAGRAGLLAVTPGVRAARIGDVGARAARRRTTGLGELDRVLGGGVVDGAVVLVAGDPGIGKSTLLLEVAARWAGAHGPALIVTGEESAAQVRLRAERVGAVHDRLYLAADTDLAAVLGHIGDVDPGLLVLDSVQTIASPEVDGAPGGVTQVRAVAGELIRVAKQEHRVVVLVGHVTKDGGIAGPRVLEHLVDVVISVEGERHGRLRMVRAVKNRYGATDEVGCFELADTGVVELPDPSGLFLSTDARTPVAGTCVTVVLEGRRPLVAEVQSLVAGSGIPSPRRATSGLDSSRVAMLLAVLERRCRVPLSGSEVYAATVGGVRITEPAADLAVALAVAGAALDRPLPARSAAFGEVGLAGEIRPVSGLPRRVAEAARLGFRTVLVPARAELPTIPGVEVVPVADVAAALRRLGSGRASDR